MQEGRKIINRCIDETLLKSGRAKKIRVIGVHMRLGDKLLPEKRHVYPEWPLSIDFIRKAIAMVKYRHSQQFELVFIFLHGGATSPAMHEKDKNWFQSNIGNLAEHSYAFSDLNESVSLSVLEQVDSLIMGPSSFPW
jgi:hypothetical protein